MTLLEIIFDNETTNYTVMFVLGFFGLIFIIFCGFLVFFSFKTLLRGTSGIKYKNLQYPQKIDRQDRFFNFIIGSIILLVFGLIFLFFAYEAISPY